MLTNQIYIYETEWSTLDLPLGVHVSAKFLFAIRKVWSRPFPSESDKKRVVLRGFYS